MENNKKSTIISIDGKRFACKCGCNVFTKEEKTNDGWNIYSCNSCERKYEGQGKK